MKGRKLRRNIKIHGELVVVNFHFPKNPKVSVYDLGSNGNYRESLKVLRVVVRMLAGNLLPENTIPSVPFLLGFLGLRKNSKTFEEIQKAQTNIYIYILAIGSCLLDTPNNNPSPGTTRSLEFVDNT